MASKMLRLKSEVDIPPHFFIFISQLWWNDKKNWNKNGELKRFSAPRMEKYEIMS